MKRILVSILSLVLCSCATEKVKPIDDPKAEAPLPAKEAVKPSVTPPKPVEPAPAKPVDVPEKMPSAKGESELEAGVKAYEDGDYARSSASLKAALDLGLARSSDRVLAYKYRAFIACATNQPKECKAHFRRALAIDSKFKLTPAESGHPVWGPIFSAAQKEALEARKKPKAARPGESRPSGQ